MAKKFSVGDVANEAVQFGMHRLMTVIRYSWLPFLAYVALLVAAAFAVVDIPAAEALDENATLSQAMATLRTPPPVAGLVMTLAIFGGLFLISGAYASIYRLVALGEERPGVFQFRIDSVARRTFWALLITGLASLFVYLVALGVSFAISGVGPGAAIAGVGEFFRLVAESENGVEPDPDEVMAAMGQMAPFLWATLLAIIPSIYLAVELTPFAAGTAAEDRLIMFKSFRMTQGAAWSIFGALALFLIFLMIISLVVSLGLGVIEIAATFLSGQGGAFALIGVALSVALVVAQIVFQAFTVAAQCALQASIYRRLEKGE